MKKLLFVALIFAALTGVAWAMAGDPPGCWIKPCPLVLEGHNADEGCYISPCPLGTYSVPPLGGYSL